MSLNVFVTGLSGIIGRRIPGMVTVANPSWTIIPVTSDLSDPAQVSEFCENAPFPDVLLHLAAIVPTGTVQADPMAAYVTNAIGTGSLIQGLLRRNPELWTLYASTSHVYQPSDDPIPETSRLEPITGYGRTKLAGEMVAKDILLKEPLGALCIARIFSVYSPDQHDSFLFPMLLSKKRTWDGKSPVAIQGWNQVRDFLSAEEVAFRLVELLKGRAEGVFNIASGKGVTIRDFAKQTVNLEIDQSPAQAAVPATSLVADISAYERYVNGFKTRG